MFWQHRRLATRLVFWSGVSFAGFALSNAMMFADLVILHHPAFATMRAATR